MTEDPETTVRATERWLDAHGLPWFVESQGVAVRRRLSRGHLVRVGLLALLVAVGVGISVGWWRDTAAGLAWGETAFAALVAGWALRSLYGSAVAGWAARRTLRSLGLLFPLASRALPLLLLFITFLFINTEVWQVTSALDTGVLWQAVLVFAVIGVGFLLARLPEELEEYDAELTAETVVTACTGTPVEQAAAELEVTEEMLERHSDVVGLERGNLVLVLLIAQAIQVLLLSIAVWVFFLVFGSVAIQDEVILDWVGHRPHYAPGFALVSLELVKVSTFLAAFAGLYFTVYAVSDANYRKQFFTRIRRELERAVSVRLVYRSLLENGGSEPRRPEQS
ncbi:hypothetical protein [Nocardioides bigeumensis]|uniref:Integral membrane protein n=1 Tax=Nocardioides bigeumensis TaxID=433657 RepID=A0ABP5JGA8_9ACTN